MSSRQGPDYIRQLLPSGQGQGGGGMQTQQQQQQLKALIISLGGELPQTSNIHQLEQLLKKTQRIHNLKEIVPFMEVDTIRYLISKGLNDDQIVVIGMNFQEEDINLMIECVPAIKDKIFFLDNLVHHGVEAFRGTVIKNKNVVENLSKTTGFSRGAIIKLLKRGNKFQNIQKLNL